MTLDEMMAREGIRDTIALVSHAGDRLDIATYVAAYTPDGVLEFRQHQQKGRDAIREFMERGAASRRANRAHFFRHNVTSTRIQLVAADLAQVYSYYHVYSQVGPDHFGDYRDTFQKHGDRWLIKHRLVGLTWVSSASPHASMAPDDPV
jgi:ketosteroid isomerase-like protein